MPHSPPGSTRGTAAAATAHPRSNGSSLSSDRLMQRQDADADLTMVSATTMVGNSSTRIDSTFSRAEEAANSLRSGGAPSGIIVNASRSAGADLDRHRSSRPFVSASDDVAHCADPSAALTLRAGIPPPSGLRDPASLLQLLPVDLLFQTGDTSSLQASTTPLLNSEGKSGGRCVGDEKRPSIITTSVQSMTASAAARTNERLDKSGTTSPSQENYRRAFSLLRCAAAPASTLSSSSSSSACWHDGGHADSSRSQPLDASALHAALGRAMAELEHRCQSGEPPLSLPAHLSAYCKSKRAISQHVDDNTVLLTSFAPDGDSLASPGLAQQQQRFACSDDPMDSAVPAVVPLLFFAAVVECPPDIRRFFLLSRTHAYLCDPDGTVAYCAAIRDVRQIIACAGGYMVWRFMPDVVVSTMLMLRVRDEKPRPAEASSSGAGSPTTCPGHDMASTTPSTTTSAAARAASSRSPNPATTPREIRDEMSDWVFRIVSVGSSRAAAPTTASPLTTATASPIVTSPAPSATDSVDPVLTFSTSLRDEGLAEERMGAMVFLLNVMCTLRTLPQLFIDAMSTRATAGAAEDVTSPILGSGSACFHTSYSHPNTGSCSTNANAAAWEQPRSALRGRTADLLDRMHVAGDRPARVPLLLEGPFGRQTAVKFIEQYWTTRYDQLPPSLRPRRLNSTSYLSSTSAQTSTTAGSPLEGGTGAHVCYVESSLLLPAIPVVSLEACLNAEDSVGELRQAAENALREAVSDPLPSGSSPASKVLGGHSRAVSAIVGTPFTLKDLATATEQEKAKSALSPAAWRVLERLTGGGDGNRENSSSDDDDTGEKRGSLGSGRRRGKKTDSSGGGARRNDDSVLTTPFPTPVTPNEMITRAHSEDTASRSSHHSLGDAVVTAAAPAVTEVAAATVKASADAAASKSRDGGFQKNSTVNSRSSDGHAHHLDHSSSSSSSSKKALRNEFVGDTPLSDTDSAGHNAAGIRDALHEKKMSSAGSERHASVASSWSNAESTTDRSLGTPALLPAPGKGGSDESREHHSNDTRLLTVVKSLASGGTSATTSSGNYRYRSSDSGDNSGSSSQHGAQSRRVEEETTDGTSHASSGPKLSHPMSKTVSQIRLRRQRGMEEAEMSDTATASTATTGAQEAKRATPVCHSIVAKAEVPPMRAEANQMPVLSLPVAANTVDAFEQRIQHRPRRDRLLLRARYIERLLQAPLRSTDLDSVSIQGQQDQLPGQDYSGSSRTHRVPAAARTNRGSQRYSLEDTDRLVDDLRRQRVIAELMYIQRVEASAPSLTAAAAGPSSFSAVRPALPSPPPFGGIDVEGWRAAALEEKLRRNSTADARH